MDHHHLHARLRRVDPYHGKLADRHGRKGVYLLCILLFGIGSALCGVAQDLGNFWILIGARVIQALGGGGIMPVATAEFGTAFPRKSAAWRSASSAWCTASPPS